MVVVYNANDRSDYTTYNAGFIYMRIYDGKKLLYFHLEIRNISIFHVFLVWMGNSIPRA